MHQTLPQTSRSDCQDKSASSAVVSVPIHPTASQKQATSLIPHPSSLILPMTPTLLGRWQTRLLLLAVLGIPISVPFMLIFGNSVFFMSVFYVALFGIGWDMFYNYLQTFRWDHDWPAALQLLAGIWEGIFLLLLFTLIGLPGFPRETPIALYLLHYSLVWLAVFTVSQTLMRIIFPRWRFHGGQWL